MGLEGNDYPLNRCCEQHFEPCSCSDMEKDFGPIIPINLILLQTKEIIKQLRVTWVDTYLPILGGVRAIEFGSILD